MLDRIKDIVRLWRDDAQMEAVLDNRVVMSAGPRTITVTIMPSYSEGDFHASEEMDSLVLSFELRGYETKVGMVDDLLDTEIALLVDDLVSQPLANNRSPKLSLNLNINGRNPFLGFYLRDIPTERIQLFRVGINESMSGHNVRVEASMNHLSVQASTATALVAAAKRYLASPALANLD